MFPSRILSLSSYASLNKFKFVYSFRHSFILSTVCVKHIYVWKEKINFGFMKHIVLGSYSPKR